MQNAIPTGILTATGLVSTPYAVTSLADAVHYEPSGVYTTARTYQRVKALLFDDHLDRLEQSAALIGLTLRLDRAALRHALRTLLNQGGYAESRFRITIPQTEPELLYLAVEPYKPVPPEILEAGARLATFQLARENPGAKTNSWMAQRPTPDSFPAGVYEGLLIGADKTLLEGLSSNFYAILDGTLRTAGEGVLPGMAQRIVLRVATDLVPIVQTAITRDDLPFVEEAFISSAGRGIVPVIQIDHQLIGDGTPGPQTRLLQARYTAWADAHLEELI